ncbi:MAG TPA: MBL fold metallo-hydrolase [Longimicrobiaceae bacterium]|nr:MBL fold metallo-hydrolase [Longimicrobiaceae bacterium]
MATLHLLGTGAGFSGGDRTTTMLAFESADSVVVVDCGGDVVQRLQAAGVELEHIEALVVTHEHADHVSGFPLFMEKIWLSGRRRPIPVHGPAPALSQARRCWESFATGGWKNVPEILWREVALEEGAPVLESEAWRITAAPGTHSVPVVGLRVEDRRGGGVAAYSCDTEESEAITRLARGADLLAHEATGCFGGHTTPEGAARVAARAGAGRLVLVHLPPEVSAGEMSRAREVFPGAELGADGQRHPF